MMEKKKLELYLHIPFCIKKCAYCDFLSFSATEEIREAYVAQLIKEIEGKSAALLEYRIVSVFIGGGTPSVLHEDQIKRIVETVKACVELSVEAEITIETNPGTLTEKKLSCYRRLGINRISMGLQSADPGELSLLGRIHSYEEFLEGYQLARAAGFTNINVDLMSALPGQTAASYVETLNKVCALQPEHISAYSLIIEEGTPFYETYKADSSDLPDEEEERRMYQLTQEILREHGYERYEISNYAKKGFQCRHNEGYWRGIPYLGLGLGASSYMDKTRFRNEDDLDRYLSLDLGALIDDSLKKDREEITEEKAMEEFMFLGLRMSSGISLRGFSGQFGIDVDQVYRKTIEMLVKQELLMRDKDRICLTPLGVDVSNYVLCQFLFDDEQ